MSIYDEIRQSITNPTQADHAVALFKWVDYREMPPTYANAMSGPGGSELLDELICRGWLRLEMDTESMVLLVDTASLGDPMFDSYEDFYHRQELLTLRTSKLPLSARSRATANLTLGATK